MKHKYILPIIFKSILLLFILSDAAISMSDDLIENNSKESEIGDSINQDWYSKTMENIKKEEYNITFAENLNAYQSPNRKNNLRFIYKNDGFIVIPRATEISVGDEIDKNNKPEKIKIADDWNAEFTLVGYGRGNKVEYLFGGKNLTVVNNRASVKDNNLKIDYLNNEDGMRQDFIVLSKPANGDGHLTLKLNIETEKRIVIGADALVIKDDNNDLMKYNSLKIWDANGKALRGWFQANENKPFSTKKQIEIVVNDIDAVYPITIDPLSTTSNWTAESDQAGASFGASVATAGDVNGDGYSDIIVGAYAYDNGETDEGKAFVYHGSATGLSTSADWTAESDQAGAHFGWSVATAGDVNGDGYSDVIVGASRYSNGLTWEGKAFVYHGSVSGLLTSADWSAESNQLDAKFGYSVSTAGDVNGDGYSDVIVSANKYDNGETNEGRAFVYHGSASGLSASADWTAESDQFASFFGESVSTAGDVNGDGYSDVIVGAYRYANGETDEGRAFVYHGSALGLSTSADWTAESDQTGAHFGYSASTAGDVNGDGYSDVIVSANEYDNGQTDEGKAFVYHGSATGLSTSADWTAESDQAGANFGWSVATAGDVNGDGYSDVIIASPLYSNGLTGGGGAYVYYGSASGLSTASDWNAENNQDLAFFGASVATAGDVNGDGFSDVIVGASSYDNGQTDEGRTFVYNGSASGLSTSANWTVESNKSGASFGASVAIAGDVNGDGYSDVIVGAPIFTNAQSREGRAFVYHGSASGLSVTADWTAESDQFNARFGNSVSTAGDVNGDGYSDVIVGAYIYDNVETDEGRAFVYHGSASGLSASADWTAEGNQSNAHFGWSVSTAGDVNGDGYSDVIVGANEYDNVETNEGRAFVFHGSASGLSASANWTAESDQVSAYFGFSASTAGDVNGDGYSDVIVSANEYDNVETNEGRAFVFHGSASGLSGSADWTAESDNAEALFGWNVSTAGDVNGDGYSDLIVGAVTYNNGLTNGGRAFVFHGSASGLSTAANWTAENNQFNARFGNSVSTAGDVNGDGYSDVIIGSHLYYNGLTGGGRAYVYYGSAVGLSTTSDWNAEINQDLARFAYSVSTAGDINGDGYSDVIVGAASYDNGEIDEGKVFVYYGNATSGLKNNVQQYKPSTTNIVGAAGFSGSNGSADLGLFSKSPYGRADGKLVYEYKENGMPFSIGSTIGNSVSNSGEGSFIDLGTTGTELKENISGLSAGSMYKWRARTEYSLVNNPYQKYGPWKYYSSYAAKIRDGFRPSIILPTNIFAHLKVYLEGPYNSINTDMDKNVTLPNTSPYSENVVSATPPANTVDWVLVELRDKDTPTTILLSKSAFILEDGNIIGHDGNPVTFTKPFGLYHVSVRHRNHLEIMTADPIYLSN